MNWLTYKGYYGTIETENDTLFGHVLGLKKVIISYEGKNINELNIDFKNGIDNYLENCKQNKERPEKTYKDIVKAQWKNMLPAVNV